MLHLKLRRILEETNSVFPGMFTHAIGAQKTVDNTGYVITLGLNDKPVSDLKKRIAGYFYSVFARELTEFHIHSVRVIKDSSGAHYVEAKIHDKKTVQGDKRGRRLQVRR